MERLPAGKGRSPLKFNLPAGRQVKVLQLVNKKIKLKKYYELPFSNKFFRAIPLRL
jgi:hypothetical protein